MPRLAGPLRAKPVTVPGGIRSDVGVARVLITDHNECFTTDNSCCIPFARVDDKLPDKPNFLKPKLVCRRKLPPWAVSALAGRVRGRFHETGLQRRARHTRIDADVPFSGDVHFVVVDTEPIRCRVRSDSSRQTTPWDVFFFPFGGRERNDICAGNVFSDSIRLFWVHRRQVLYVRERNEFSFHTHPTYDSFDSFKMKFVLE